MLERIRARFLDQTNPKEALRVYQRKMELVWRKIERLEERPGTADEVAELWRQFEAMERKEMELLWAARKERDLI